MITGAIKQDFFVNCSQTCAKIAKMLCRYLKIIIDNSDVCNLTTRANVAVDQTDPLIRLKIFNNFSTVSTAQCFQRLF